MSPRTFRLLKMGTLCNLERSGSAYQLTQSHVTEEQNAQLRRCENIRIIDIITLDVLMFELFAWALKYWSDDKQRPQNSYKESVSISAFFIYI